MFQQVNFGYSRKNIIIPNKKEYLMQLTHSLGTFVNNLRWRAEIYLRPKPYHNSKENYGFKSLKNAGPVPELKEFEDKLYDLTKNIKFKEVPNSFQKKLKSDVNKIENDPRVYLAADKTTNLYKVNPEDAEHLIEKEINKEYRKAEPDIVDKLTEEAKVIAEKLEIEDRVFETTKRDAFHSLKDHKPNKKK